MIEWLENLWIALMIGVVLWNLACIGRDILKSYGIDMPYKISLHKGEPWIQEDEAVTKRRK